MERSAGVIMHIASLPGKFGIGTFGKEAYEYVEFLYKSGMRYWQILPLGQTGYGDSPYQSFSAFAGNPYFIDFDILNDEGILSKAEYINENYGDNEECIDYGLLFNIKYIVLRRAYENFKKSHNFLLKEYFESFKEENNWWLDNYSLYMAVKGKFNLASWQEWDDDIKKRRPETIELYRNELSDEIEFWSFIQFLFFKQWNELKSYANEKGIKIIGDMPIYVAEDSADVWSNPEAYLIYEETLKPISIAGCPPDAFSETGQLWGNPLYDWNYMEKTGYKWWIKRVEESLKLYDVVRIDHFRGFESYWEIPFGEKTAVNGKWKKGPKEEIFNVMENKLGKLNIIAEDLGDLTDEVLDLRDELGFPGMKILQFAFDSDEANAYLPFNYGTTNCVVYTGTHDNDTTKGWYSKADKKATDYVRRLLNISGEDIAWDLIRMAEGSVAKYAVIPVQDVMNLGSKARMNTPGKAEDNWQFRFTEDMLTDDMAKGMKYLAKIYNR